MKKLLSVILVLFTLIVNAQDIGVEKSVFGIQTGFLGIWGHNELKLSNSFALRTEAGINLGIIGGSMMEHAEYILSPTLSLEPRYYYNLLKRSEKSKDISGNCGNFISLKTGFTPGWYYSPYSEFYSDTKFIFIAPTWGIRRNIGKSFNYELGLGFGYGYYFSPVHVPRGQVVINPHLRIGYRF